MLTTITMTMLCLSNADYDAHLMKEGKGKAMSLLSSPNSLMELWINPEDESWIVLSRIGKVACAIERGQGVWVMVDPPYTYKGGDR